MIFYFLFFIFNTSICFSEQFYFEDFSTNNFPPAGWETSGSPIDSNRWNINNYQNSYNTTPPALSYRWSPSSGGYEPYSHEMLSPTIPISGNTSVLVLFDIALDFWGTSNFTNGMTISYSGGGDWIDILNYEIGPGAGYVEINRRTESFIAEIISGNDIQLKFTAYGTCSFYINDWFIDNIEIVSAPKLDMVTITSSNNNLGKAIVGDEILINISSNSELIADPDVLMNGNISDVLYGGDNRWTASYIVQSSDPDGPIEFSIDFTDINNVDGITVRQSTDNSNVIIDNSNPPNFIVGNVNSVGGNVHSNIWNETNLVINLEASVPQDSAVSSYNYIDGNSLLFDGENDQASIPIISEYQFTNNMTIEAWIKPLSVPEDYTGFLNRAIDSGPLEAGIGFVFSSTGWRFFLKTDFPNSIDYTTMPVASAPINQWTHLAATYNGSKVILFRNGTALDSSNVYGDIEWLGAPTEIILGSFTKDGMTKYFNGHIDDVRFWNIVRTPQEIKLYRKVELEGNETGLIGYWRVDESEGVLLEDFSLISNDGDINGAIWEIEDSPLQFKTPIYDTGVIIGSTFQLLGRVGLNDFEEFGSRDTINQEDFDNGIKYVSALKSDFEGINDFGHDQTAQLKAYLYDDAGNFSVSDISGTNVIIDNIANAPNPISIYSSNQFQDLANTADTIKLSMLFDENINSLEVLINGNISNSIQDLGSEEFEAIYILSGDESNGRLGFSISVIDYYGNQNEYNNSTTDGTSVRFDNISPILNQVIVNSNNFWNQSWAKVGDTIQFFTNANEDLLNISGLVEGNNMLVTLINLDQYNLDYIFSNFDLEGLVDFEIIFSDSAGNNGEIITNTTNDSYIIFDKTNPENFAVGDVVPTGGNIVSNAWNSTNTGMDIIIPINNDESLDSGRIQIQAKIAANIYENLGNYNFIVSNDLNNFRTISISENFVRSITGYTEDDTITINAVIFDIPGNSTIGNESLSKLVINESLPIVINSSIESDFSDSSLAGIGNIITLSFETDTEIQVPSVLISGQPAEILQIENNNWEAIYAMQGSEPDGQVLFAIDFVDIHGNPNSEINNTIDGTSVIFDNSKPSLSYVAIKSSNKDSTWARSGDTIIIKFKSNELLTDQIVTIVNNDAEIYEDILNDSIEYYAKYVMGETDIEGNIDFEIIVIDTVGIESNPVNETTDNSSVIFDRTMPIINSLHIESNNINNNSICILGDHISLTFSSNESLIIDSIFVNIAGENVTTLESENIYISNYTINGNEPGGYISYLLNYQDLAGNQGIQIDSTLDSSYVIHDLIPPEIINCYISSNNSDSSWAKGGDSVYVTFFSSEPLNNINIEIANVSADYTQKNPTKYIGYLFMNNDFEQEELSFMITYTDLGGIPGDTIINTTNSSRVKFDNEAPFINNVLMKTNNIYSDTLAGIGTIDTLSFSISEPYRTLNVLLDNSINIPIEDNLNFYSINTFDEIDSSYWIQFSISMVDSAGNISETINQESLERQVWFDGQRPIIDSVIIFSNNINNSMVCTIGDSVYLKYSASESLRITNSLIANLSPNRIFQSNGFYNSVYCITGNENEGIIPFSIFDFEDIVGNIGLETNISSNYENVILDMTNPSDFILGNIFSKEGNEKIGYWNSTNRKLEITIPIDEDSTLSSGSIQIQVKFEEIYNDLGDLIFINQNSLGRDTTIIIEKNLLLNQEEFDEDKNAIFRALLWDKSGNSVISEISNSILHIDTVLSVIDNIHIESNNLDSTLAKTGDSLFISFEVNELLDSISISVLENLCYYDNINYNWRSYYKFQEFDIEGFTSFNIYIEDMAGNINPIISETTDGSVVYFDRTKPILDSVNFFSSNKVDQELAIIGDSLFLEILSDELISNIGMYISENDSIYNLVDTIVNNEFDNHFWQGWKILNGTEKEGFISFKIGFKDLAGNIADTVSMTTNNSTILFDRTPPEDFTIKKISSNNGNEIDGYWNSTNDNLIFYIPISNDNTLLNGGGIQVQSSFEANYLDLGSIYYIEEEFLNKDNIIIIPKVDFESLNGYGENIDAHFRAKIWDKAGNTTISLDTATILHIDIINPAINSVNIFSNNIFDSSWAKVSDSLFIDFISSETLAYSKMLINNRLSNGLNIYDLNWQLSSIISNEFEEDTVSFKIFYRDLAGNIGDTISNTSNNSYVKIDKTNPIVTSLYDGSDSIDLDYYNDSSSITFYWQQLDSVSGIKDAFITYSQDTINLNNLVWELSNSGLSFYTMDSLSLKNNDTYFAGLYIRDFAGNVSDTVWSNGFILDMQIPDTGSIKDGQWFLEMDYTPDSTSLKYTWSGFSDNIGIRNYELSIGTNNHKTNILNWVKTDSLKMITISDLFLDRDTCYYTYLRAYDSALNISEIIRTDGIYFDDSEPKVVNISPDLSDSIGFLSILKKDTIEIEFNRNIFFYNLNIKSKVDSNFTFNQSYSDSILTISWDDTLASYDTLTVFLDSALAYNTLFVSETLSFVSQLWGDLNNDYEITVKDIYAFNKQWPNIDIGPFEGVPPNVYPNLDGEINLIDMSAFAKMWHWKYFNLSFDSNNFVSKKAYNLDLSSKENNVIIKIPKDIYMGELLIGNSNINISNIDFSKILPSTFVFERLDSLANLRQFSFADKNGLDSIIKLKILNENKEYFEAQIQYLFLDKIGDTISYGNEEIFIEILPKIFKVYSNYPNPFNPITNIRFDLSQTNNIDIVIYDIMGREVFNYNIEKLKAGRHEFIWNGLNNKGNKVSSGVYLFQLKSGFDYHIQKMLLLK